MPESITESVATVNTKTLGDSPAFYTQLAMGNAIAHQNRSNIIAETAMAASVKQIQEMDPIQALSLARVGFASTDTADTISKLASAGASAAGL